MHAGRVQPLGGPAACDQPHGVPAARGQLRGGLADGDAPRGRRRLGDQTRGARARQPGHDRSRTAPKHGDARRVDALGHLDEVQVPGASDGRHPGRAAEDDGRHLPLHRDGGSPRRPGADAPRAPARPADRGLRHVAELHGLPRRRRREADGEVHAAASAWRRGADSARGREPRENHAGGRQRGLPLARDLAPGRARHPRERLQHGPRRHDDRGHVRQRRLLRGVQLQVGRVRARRQGRHLQAPALPPPLPRDARRSAAPHAGRQWESRHDPGRHGIWSLRLGAWRQESLRWHLQGVRRIQLPAGLSRVPDLVHPGVSR
mmetsp:Transcript_8553/g.25201  ORF Transcript_8553/g.25201 Transcript_8553/m.25201 type:complete len:319 (-) Transcript_8553:220-1176(-)